MRHRLDPLLRPESVAIVGASARSGAAGEVLLRQTIAAGWQGKLWPVNPRYREIMGRECYPSVADLPGRPDLVILAVGNAQIEAEMDHAIAAGARAVVLYSSLYVEEEADRPLLDRVRDKARRAGLIVCGGNGMGFYNFETGLWACAFDTRTSHRAGGIALITHSGSVFNSLLDAEERLDFNIAVSPGQELTASAADYLDFALELPSTKVVGLVIETLRDPEGFVAALEKAAQRRIPVVILKLGRTAASAEAALSHSGALTGSHAAYQALFARYGVAEVRTIEELGYTLLLFAHAGKVGPGGLATIHDSGGERELLMDLAADHGVPLPALAPETVSSLASKLEYGLLPMNPLDAWGTGRDNEAMFGGGFLDLVSDPGIAIGALVCDRSIGSGIEPIYRTWLETARAVTGKPVCLVTNHQGSGQHPEAIALSRDGMPVIDGVVPFLVAVGHLFRFRDFTLDHPVAIDAKTRAAAEVWRPHLTRHRQLDEGEALRLIAGFDIPAVPSAVATNLGEARVAAMRFGYPVVLKTAAPGIAHKSDGGGVYLGIGDENALARAFDSLVTKFGPPVRVAPMISGGVEMMLGVTQDAQLGPLVTLGFGGIYAEFLREVGFLLPPFSPAAARRVLDGLRLRPLLDGARGKPPVDIAALCVAASRVSLMAASLGADLGELDINPLVALPNGAVALDALVVTPLGSSTREAVSA